MAHFRSSYPRQYSSARHYKLLKEVASLYPKKRYHGGVQFCEFKEACEANNNGYGYLYILEINDTYEGTFIKIGVTSRDLEVRHERLLETYDYTVLDLIEADCKFIWDLEKYLKRELKPFWYFPEYKLQGFASECYKLHKNSKQYRNLIKM
jgi:hypothetical protein